MQGRLVLDFPDEASARQARAALAPDDEGTVRLTVEGHLLHMDAESASILGLLRTLDDVLSCLRATGVP